MRVITCITQVAGVRLQCGRREEVICTFRIGEPFGKPTSMTFLPISKRRKPTGLQSSRICSVALSVSSWSTSSCTSIGIHISVQNSDKGMIFLFISCMACLIGTRTLGQFCLSLWTAEELPVRRICSVIKVLCWVETALFCHSCTYSWGKMVWIKIHGSLYWSEMHNKWNRRQTI